MKKIITTIAAVAMSAMAFAQLVPNGSFESATGSNFDNWTLTGGRAKVRTIINISVNGTPITIRPATGTKFLGLLNDSPAVNNQIAIGRINTVLPMTRRPASLKFKFQYLTSVATESFFGVVVFFQSNPDTKRRDTLQTNVISLSQRGLLLGNAGAWLQLTYPLSYAKWDADAAGALSDSCSIEFFSTGNMESGTSSTTTSTELLVDDVEFTTWGTGVTSVTNVNASEISNFPNPFSNTTAINYNLAIPSENVSLTVVDINGKEVFTKNLGKQDAGDLTINFDGTDLNNGVYFYTLTSDNNRQTGKMMISK
ncbi:MAG: T9SS type A sorting domain-containing protein [Candidatus Methylacidiphilales bacterium]